MTVSSAVVRSPHRDQPPPLVSVRGLTKSFGSIRALKGVDIDLRRGSVQALLGENGAGKSTLIKILAGVHQPDAGVIRVNGQETTIDSPAAARQLGLCFVFQELASLPSFSVAEYITVGTPYPRRWGLIDWQAVASAARVPLERIGAGLGLQAKMSSLTVAEQRLAEIAKGLLTGSDLLVLDEPTASLSDREVEHLFSVLRALQDAGVAILYVSHRLEEIQAIADTVTVFRDGALIETDAIEEFSTSRMIQAITGTDEIAAPPATPRAADQQAAGPVMLEADRISTRSIQNLSFSVHAGEVLGLAGLVGSGRTEALRAVAGADRLTSGSIHVDGEPVQPRGISDMMRAGVTYLPEERRTQGLLNQMTIRENITAANVGRYSRRRSFGLLLDQSKERAAVARWVDELQIKCGRLEDGVNSLSGGNQQKVVLARLLDTNARTVLLDEPTKGVDVGAKQEIFRIVESLAKQGAGVVFVSSELDEIPQVCDRALVLREGVIVGELVGDELTKSRILELAFQTQEEEKPT